MVSSSFAIAVRGWPRVYSRLALSLAIANVVYGSINGVFEEQRIQVYPNRSLSAPALQRILAFFFAACAVVAVFSWAQGNFWAPIFALLNVSAVALGLRAAWRASQACDLLFCAYVSDATSTRQIERLIVENRRGRHAVRCEFDPLWAQVVQQAHTGGPARLLLISHGRSVELGSFLNADQRETLSVKIKEFLRKARERAIS